LVDGNGNSLVAMEASQLTRRYYGNPSTPGDPEAYAMASGAMLLGPIPSSTRSDLQLVYRRSPTPLVNDGDVSVIPVEFHLHTLVFGAASNGLLLQNDPTWQGFESKHQAGIEAMKAAYLGTTDDLQGQWPAYRAAV